MKRRHESVYIDEYGDIVSGATGTPIKEPAVLIDPNDSMLYGYGETETVLKKQTVIRAKLAEASCGGAVPDLVVVQLNQPDVDKNVIVYIMRRMIEHTGNFIREFYQHACRDDALEWLKDEMERVKLD